jgi:uncharacterized membrane protein
MFTPFWSVPGELAPVIGAACFEFHPPANRVCECIGNPRYHEFMGNFGSILICFVPRILIGTFSGLLAKYMPKKSFPANYIAGSIVGTLTNTLLVVGGMYLFFAPRIEPIWGQAATVFLGAIITGNGIPEVIVAAILCPAICIPVAKFLRSNN